MDLKRILRKTVMGTANDADCVQGLAYLDCHIFFIEKKMTPRTQLLRKLLLARLKKCGDQVTSLCGCN